MKLTFIFTNILTEITFHFYRFEPVIRNPDNDSCITLNSNEFLALSTI
jgi:hypothetical protein